MRQWRGSAVYVPEMSELARLWLEERGISVLDVPVDGFIERIDDMYVQVEVFQRDSAGGLIFDETPDGEHRPRMTWVKVRGPFPHDALLEDVR